MNPIVTVITSQIARNLYPGASLALFNEGRWSEYYLGTIDGFQPVRSGLRYDLASVSKVVGVGTVMVQLINQGLLELDNPLSTYYPYIRDKSITIRELLTHSSGIDPFIPNRNQLTALELREAINQIGVTLPKTFLYTDINFLLLGFLLEDLLNKPLSRIFEERVFQPFAMSETGFGPVKGAVPTQAGQLDGLVHDPKARVLGEHAGSAGLFSTLSDLERFSQHYLTDDFASALWQNYSYADKPRSLAWNLEGDWIEHTGYTGSYLALNRKEEKAAIFLTNRTYAYDDRALWIRERQQISQMIQRCL